VTALKAVDIRLARDCMLGLYVDDAPAYDQPSPLFQRLV